MIERDSSEVNHRHREIIKINFPVVRGGCVEEVGQVCEDGALRLQQEAAQ